MAGKRRHYYKRTKRWSIPAVICILLLTAVLTTLVQGSVAPADQTQHPNAEGTTPQPWAQKRAKRIVAIGKRQQSKENGSVQPETPREETPQPEEKTCVVAESAAVEDTYFSDAIFIGNSRTEGFMLYSGLKGSQSLTTVGLTVSEAFNKKTITVGGKKMTMMDALATKQFAKIYIMLGMNELGWVYPEQYQKQYGEIIDRVREINPDALIYIQSILPVSKAKDEEGTYINNERIRMYNGLLLELAEEKDVAYVNVAEAVSDEEGNLPPEASFDGEHLVPEYCKVWLSYLKTHTIEGLET
ncbi:hypothetical protein H8790_00125 [Oscillibacter hominis]|uniref:SGNH hydrolase-type esterase domain-containing protein n=1 Tax=Oscillibacter hominis TaxID=2763056 RepID=A0A7G9B4M2_9FIRM|nr:GDSL-type esterase/lipase family protein [Oscillibacter hominis]QNL44503.1 hypothetical protein H8790_00125 [Oscillibacter hominis]